MLKKLLEKDLKKAIKKLGFENSPDIVCNISENPDFGDYSSNVALQLTKLKSKKSYQSSQEIANDILKSLGHPSFLERIDIREPGFLNFFVKDKLLLDTILNDNKEPKKIKNKNSQRILIEYSSPNAAKPYHIGHLRNIITGESISRLKEYQGNQIFRMTYNSDIGPAFAKVIWGVKQNKKLFNTVKLGSLAEKVNFLGESYVTGNKAYEEVEEAKKEIEAINLAVYKKDPETLNLWSEIKKWSAEYIDSIHHRLGSKFDSEVWESEVGEIGKKIVLDNLGKVFKEDQGAIIFAGEEFGLHNRVFINSQGNPTYEAKDVGLAFKELELFPFDLAIHVVGNEQTEYFRVIFKAIELVNSSFIGKKKHLPYGFITLPEGKMSSRKGNVITVEELIEQTIKQIKKNFLDQRTLDNDSLEKIAQGAIKFAFLKFSLISDIIFDIDKAISLQGDSGPYLQYVYARIQSVLNRSGIKISHPGGVTKSIELEEEERELLRLLNYFDEIVEKAANELKPNELCTYLLNLAKTFNSFYEKSQIIGSEKQQFRLLLSKKVDETIKQGLYLLGIDVLDKM